MIGRPAPAEGPTPPPPREPVQRWRLVLSRAAGDDALVQRALLNAWEAAFAASGLPVAGLDSDPPKARFALGAPLSAGFRGERELVDVTLVERLPRWRVREALEPVVPHGHTLVEVEDVWLGEPALPGQVVASVYRAQFAGEVDGSAVDGAIQAMVAASALPRERRKGEGMVSYDLRPFVESLERLADGTLAMTLRHDPEKGLGRPDEVLAELGDRLGSGMPAVRIVRERLVLASERPRDARQTAAAPARRGRK